MIERLHYLALPKDEESPRSVLMRTAMHNGYPSVTQLGSRFGLQVTQPLSLQIGDAPLIGELLKEAGEHKERFGRIFYTQAKGVTKATPVAIMGTLTPLSAFGKSHHKVCPACLEEGYLKSIQDVDWVNVCPYHGICYLTECPGCGKPFSWIFMQISTCRCGCHLDPHRLPRIEADAEGARLLLEYLRKGDATSVQRLNRILAALKFEQADDIDARIQLFNQAASISSEPERGLKIWLSKMREKCSGLPARVLLAPFLAMRDDEVTSKAQQLLDTCSPDFVEECRECYCREGSLTEPQTCLALGISSQTLASLVTHGFLEKRLVGKRGVEFPYQSLCKFYGLFKPVKIRPGIMLEALCPPNSFAASLSRKLELLQANSLVLAEADARQPLSRFLIAPILDEEPSLKSSTVIPEGHISVRSVAERLGVYPDAVRRALQAGFISKAVLIGKANTVFVPETDVAEFERTHVFIGPLARQCGAKATAFSAQLATAGILPVSGPRIDQGLVALYRAEDLAGHDLKKIAAMPKFQTRAGRKKGDPIKYSGQEWLRAADVGGLLKMSVQYFSALVDYGLLVEGVPPGREADNTRFFGAESVGVTQQWLDSAKTPEEIAKREGSTKAQILKRFVASGNIKPLYLGKKTLISGEDVQRIHEHRKLYCTCPEAAAHIGAQQRHFHNMIKLGKISPVPEEETGVGTVILLRWGDVRGPNKARAQAAVV